MIRRARCGTRGPGIDGKRAFELVGRLEPAAPVLDVVVPVYNEQAQLEATIRRLDDHLRCDRCGEDLGPRQVEVHPGTDFDVPVLLLGAALARRMPT